MVEHRTEGCEFESRHTTSWVLFFSEMFAIFNEIQNKNEWRLKKSAEYVICFNNEDPINEQGIVLTVWAVAILHNILFIQRGEDNLYCCESLYEDI